MSVNTKADKETMQKTIKVSGPNCRILMTVL